MFSFFSSNNSRKGIAVIILIAVVFGLFSFNIKEAQAKMPKILQGLIELWATSRTGDATLVVSGVIGDFARQIIEGLSNIIWTASSWCLGIFANLFSNVLDFTTGRLAETPVYQGWKISRDIVNMFFILGLIVIAFATILRIESYGMKSLLPKLIIIAILINFSFLACGIIIDAAHITTNFFTSKIEKHDDPENEIGIGGQLQAAMIDLKGIKKPEIDEIETEDETETEEGETPLSTFASFIIAQGSQSVVMFIAAAILLLGAVLLVIRLGALWILIVLAPFAWFFGIFPSLKHMNSKWWNNFLKYAFFAPIYAFFVYLGLYLISAINIEAININAAENFTKSIATLTHYLIAVMIFGGAPIVAMSMGIHGSKAVVASAKRIGKGAVGVPTRAAVRVAGRWAARKGLPTPRTIKQAWKQRREEKERKAYEPAIGAWRDRFNKYLSLGKDKTFYEQRAHDFAVDKERSNLRKQDLGKDALVDQVKAARKSNNMDKLKAGMLELASRADENGIFEDTELGAKYKHETSPKAAQQFIKNSISDEKEAISFAARFGNAAKAAGLPQYSDLVSYDPQKKMMNWTLESRLGEKGGEKIMKTSPEARWKTMHPRIFFNERNGKPVQVSNSFKTILQNLEREDVKQVVENMSTFNKKRLIEGENQIQQAIDEVRGKDPGQANIAQQWIGEIKKSLTGKGGGKSETKVITEPSEKEFKESRKKHKPGEFG